MSPLRRGPDKTRRDVEAFLDETYPGADARTRLHALICWVYHLPLFEGRGSKEAVISKVAARGVTRAKLRQIVAGDPTGIRWGALEAVLVACGASKADIEAAQDLFDQVQMVPPFTIPPAGSAPWTDPLEDWAPTRLSPPVHRPRTEPPGPPPWTWPDDQTWPGDPAEPSPIRPFPDPASDHGVDSTETPVRCGENVPDCIAAGLAPAARTDIDQEELDGSTKTGPPAEIKEAPAPAPRDTSDTRNLSVDPQTATDPITFVELMRKFRTLKGERPFREMAKVCARHPKVKRPYSYASFSTIGNTGKLPKRDLVCAYVAGCGGSDAEIDLWVQAHARLSIEQTNGPSSSEA